MTQLKHIPEAQRLAEQTGPVGSLLRRAADWEPPEDARERIWQRLSDPSLRLAESEAPALAGLLRHAIEIEPPAGAQDRIWRNMVEEHAALAGEREPARLAASDDLVAGLVSRAADLEPGYGKQSRIFRALRTPAPQPMRWGIPLAVAMAAALLFGVFHFQTPAPAPAPQVAQVHNKLPLNMPVATDLVRSIEVGSGEITLAMGESLVVGKTGTARFQAPGVGDVILGGTGTSIKLQRADVPGVHIELAQGRISLHAAKRTRADPLVIHAQGAEVEVVGTIFSVETTTSGPRVYVREGLVRVRSAGESHDVPAGHSWPETESIAAWAADAMSTLAGESAQLVRTGPKIAATPPVVKKTTETETKVAEERVVEEKPAPVALVTPPPVVEAPKVVEPVVVEPPAVPRERISRDSEGGYKNVQFHSTETAEGTLADLVAKSRTIDVQQRVLVNERIIELATQAHTSQMPEARAALVALGTDLMSIGDVTSAIDHESKLVDDHNASAAERASALKQVLVGYLVLNRSDLASKFVGSRLHLLSEQDRAAAYVILAQLRANKGDEKGALEALREASRDQAAPDTAAKMVSQIETSLGGFAPQPLRTRMANARALLHTIDLSKL